MIAKIVSGSSFGETLDYLLNPKKEQQERVEKDLQEREQGWPEEAERTPPAEAKTRDEMGRRDDKNLDAPGAEKGGKSSPKPKALSITLSRNAISLTSSSRASATGSSAAT